MNLKKPNKSCIVLGLIIILLSSFVFSAYTAPVIYFADSYPGIGAVYRLENGKEEAYYTRSRQRLHSFAFTKNNVLYFSDANDFNVNKVEKEEEVLVYSHTTYIRHIEFDSRDQLYFSQSSGGGADGYIYRLVNGKPSLYYRVRISDVGYWS